MTAAAAGLVLAALALLAVQRLGTGEPASSARGATAARGAARATSAGRATAAAPSLHAEGADAGAGASCAGVRERCLPPLHLVDLHGVTHALGARDGKVVVVNFWSTWCEPCLREIPAFVAVQRELGPRGVTFFGVLDDDVSSQVALDAAAELGMTYPSAMIDPRIIDAFDDPRRLPTTFVFDRRGALQLAHVGPLTADALTAVLEPLLAPRRGPRRGPR
jgi:thiol-disulfide isomerase/thioredoxin